MMKDKSLILNILNDKPALLIFAFIFSVTGLNAIFNSLSFSLGLGFPYATFLFDPGDLFADYFKVIFSYPGYYDLNIGGAGKFSELLRSYMDSNPYKGLSGLSYGELTHFHLTPLSTMLSLLILKAMHLMAPVITFVTILFFGFVAAHKFFKSISRTQLDAWLLFLSIIISYPTLIMVTRGNIFAGITFMMLIPFLVFMYQNRNKYLAFFLLAIAVNIRPNAIVFLFALGLCDSKNLQKDIPIFIGMSLIIFLASLFLANAMYPDYSVTNMLLGITIYHDKYVIGNDGLAFGSSLFGPLKVIFGYSKVLEALPIIITIIMVAISAWQLHNKRISKIAFLFILCASYVLGSAVIGDYHLTVFFAPLLCIYLEQKKGHTNSSSSLLTKELLIVFFASLFVLCPKNYIYIKHTSIQIALNPLLLLIASILIIKLGYLNSRYSHLAK